MSEEKNPVIKTVARSVVSVTLDTAGQGFKAIKLSLLFIFIFLIPNLVFIGIGIAGLIKADITGYIILYFVLILLFAVIACVVAAFLTYEYLIIDTIRIVYAYLIPVFKSLCRIIAGQIKDGKKGFIKKGYDWSEHITDCFQKTYNSKIPQIGRAHV